MSDYTLLLASDRRRTRWRNGGGWTSEVIAWPDGSDWDWRLSVADIEAAGPFSAFPGVERTIALVSGNGFTLTIANAAPTTISRRYLPFRFSGDDAATCTLADGPVQDLNLMVRRAAAPRLLDFVNVVDAVELAEVEVALVLSGQVRVGDDTLNPMDAIRPARLEQRISVSSVGVGPHLLGVVKGIPARRL